MCLGNQITAFLTLCRMVTVRTHYHRDERRSKMDQVKIGLFENTAQRKRVNSGTTG